MKVEAKKYRLEKRSPEAKIFGHSIQMIQVRSGLTRRNMAARLGLTDNSYREMIFGGWLPIVEGEQWKRIYEILRQDFKDAFQAFGAPLAAYNEEKLGVEHANGMLVRQERDTPRKELCAMLGEAFGKILHYHGVKLSEAVQFLDTGFGILKLFKNGSHVPSRAQGTYARILEGLKKNCASGFQSFGAPLEAFGRDEDMAPFLEAYQRRLREDGEKSVERRRLMMRQQRQEERIGELLVESFRKVIKHHGYGRQNVSDNPMSRHRIAARWGITVGILQHFLRSKWAFDPKSEERWQKVLAGLRADCAEGLEKYGAPLLAFDQGLPLDSFLAEDWGEELTLPSKPRAPTVRLRADPSANEDLKLMADPVRELRKSYPNLCAAKEEKYLKVYERLAAQEGKQGEVDEILSAEKWRRDVSSFIQENDLTDPLGGFAEASARVSFEDMLQVRYADPETPLPVFRAALEEVCLRQAILTQDGQAKKPEGHRAKLLLRRYQRLSAGNG